MKNENKNIQIIHNTNGKRKEFIMTSSHATLAPTIAENKSLKYDVGSEWFKLDSSTVYKLINIEVNGDATWVALN